MRQLHPRQRQAHRFGAGRKQQPVVGDLAAVFEYNLARTCVDVGDGRLELKIDSLIGVVAVVA